MNVKKPTDYSAMFAALDTLMAAALSQMELYCEIGKLVSARPEKGAAVAAAEYLSKVYPAVSGFSPRNLRRMRDFYRAYENSPKTLSEAMTIGWSQNVVILEGCESLEERMWYIRAVRQFAWTKAELLDKIHNGVYLRISLDLAEKVCYIEKNSSADKNVGQKTALANHAEWITHRSGQLPEHELYPEQQSRWKFSSADRVHGPPRRCSRPLIRTTFRQPDGKYRNAATEHPCPSPPAHNNAA